MKVKNLKGCELVFLNDGVLAIAYNDSSVHRTREGGFLLEMPVTYYSEEWDWLDGSTIYVDSGEGIETARGEALAWHRRASLTGSPV
jgi:hypothetical protein